MNGSAPSRKVTVGGAASGVVTIGVWYLNSYQGAAIPAEIAVAGSGVLTFFLQYFIPDKGA